LTPPKPLRFDALFSAEELDQIGQALELAYLHKTYYTNPTLGRIQASDFHLPQALYDKLINLVKDVSGRDLAIVTPPLFVEYNLEYGQPNLRPHFDGDYNEYILNFQLTANTVWPLGVDLDIYELSNNSAVLFQPNKNIHWRPKKVFSQGEYVRMIFFRFFDSENQSDYSYLPNHPDDPVFKEVSDFRDSLSL
jgi:hypothetical protein